MSRSNLRCQPPPPAAGSLERDRDRRTGVRLRRLMGVALRDRLGDTFQYPQFNALKQHDFWQQQQQQHRTLRGRQQAAGSCLKRAALE